jgi:hypothetical protein
LVVSRFYGVAGGADGFADVGEPVDFCVSDVVLDEEVDEGAGLASLVELGAESAPVEVFLAEDVEVRLVLDDFFESVA